MALPLFNKDRTVVTARGVNVTFNKKEVEDAKRQIAAALIARAALKNAIEIVQARGMFAPRLVIALGDSTASTLDWADTPEESTERFNTLIVDGIEVFKGTVGDDETLIVPVDFHFPHRVPRTAEKTIANTIAGIRPLTPLMPLLTEEGEMQPELCSDQLPTLQPQGGTNIDDALWAVGHFIMEWFTALEKLNITPETVEVLIFSDGVDVRSIINLADLKGLFKQLRKLGQVRINLFGIQTGRDEEEAEDIKVGLDQLSKAIGALLVWAGGNLQEALSLIRMSQLDPEGLETAVKRQRQQGILPAAADDDEPYTRTSQLDPSGLEEAVRRQHADELEFLDAPETEGAED